MIYLDNASTTKVFSSSADIMHKACTVDFFNPSATYKAGINVKNLINNARKNIAQSLGCDDCELYFTSCATESNNWIFNSVLKNQRQNFIISAGEHASIYEPAIALKNKGFDLRIAPLKKDGSVNVEKLLELVDENTALVSVIHCSNETGVINDIYSISRTIKMKNQKTLFHSDGVQAFLKTDFSLKNSDVDFYSISGHKVGAPKGIGALYINKTVSKNAFILGGGQENAMRSGTENVPAILAFSDAVDNFINKVNFQKIHQLSEYLEKLLLQIEDVKIVSFTAERCGFISCIVAKGIKAEVVQTMCADAGVMIGRGSSCSSKKAGNRVLANMGLTQFEIDGALRISIGVDTTENDINYAVDIIEKCILQMRGKKIG